MITALFFMVCLGACEATGAYVCVPVWVAWAVVGVRVARTIRYTGVRPLVLTRAALSTRVEVARRAHRKDLGPGMCACLDVWAVFGVCVAKRN